MSALNLWVVPVAAVSSFALGGLWFSPLLFGKIQEREMRKRGETAPIATPRILVPAFAFTLIEATAFAWLLGPDAEWGAALRLALVAGGCFAAAGTGINYLFTGRGARLWLIDGGFHVARFFVYGLVLGAWE